MDDKARAENCQSSDKNIQILCGVEGFHATNQGNPIARYSIATAYATLHFIMHFAFGRLTILNFKFGSSLVDCKHLAWADPWQCQHKCASFPR